MAQEDEANHYQSANSVYVFRKISLACDDLDQINHECPNEQHSQNKQFKQLGQN